MKPDRTNYEIWLVDYIDGRLSGEQERELLSFLENNPDIKEEFEGISPMPLNAPEIRFMKKNSLKHTAEEITEAQFEMLCAASVENDLNKVRLAEYEEMIAGDEQKRRTAELFLKTKLTPPVYIYPYKGRLKKLTLVQKAISYSAIGLSAAATVLIMFTVIKNPGLTETNGNPGDLLTSKTEEKSVVTVQEKTDQKHALNAEVNVSSKNIAVNEQRPDNLMTRLNEKIAAEMKIFTESNNPADSSQQADIEKRAKLSKINGIIRVHPEGESSQPDLISLNIEVPVRVSDEEDNAAHNFFTRIIREKILRSETNEKGKLKAYEVADAGITGINRLLGSNMSLKKTTDENGEVKSVYFSSKLLKFNAPVKKAEPAE